MRKIKILYVEDEPFLGRIVKDSLESRDFEVYMVAEGNKAMAVFEKEKPDICVLDIMLPKKDGYSIAIDIRHLNPIVPILFLTAKTQSGDFVKGFESGGNDYIKKPFSMEELIVRINNLLTITQQTSQTAKESLMLGAFEFNISRYELKINDHVKKLSHREASLLKILCDNKNATTSRKEILLSVWGDDSFFNSRNLDVYITKLREYLREDPSIQIITIKGFGYHFAVGN
jgi:DNA-binding response OmpR family regulator